MTVTGLALAYEYRGVEVHVLRRAEVPLRHLLKKPLLPLEEVHLGFLGAPDEDEAGDPPLDTAPMRIQGLAPSDYGRPGVVVASESLEAGAFLLDRYEPRSGHELDALVREARARKGSKYARIEWLLTRLRHDDDEDDDWFIPHPVRRRRGRGRTRCLWSARDFRQSFKKAACSSPPILLAAEGGRFRRESSTVYVVSERVLSLRGHRVPQWDVLVVQAATERHPVVCGWSEGRWLDQPLAQLDARVQEAFDRNGRFVRVRGMDLLMGEVLSPRFVVKVPGRGPTRASREEGAVPEAARGLPAAFLKDSRCPMDLPPDLPVVDDPVGAWAILLRTTSGIFQPDASPSDPPEACRALTGAYLVGSVPDLNLPRRTA